MSIVLKDLRKAFGSNQVLRGFTLEVHEGETLVILGASGSGKSVALKHMVGLLSPDRGEVWVDGRNLATMDREEIFELRRRIGYVFQFAALFDSMTVAENVGMGLRRVSGLTDEEIDERVQGCLSLVELEGLGARYPAELSGGQKKRVGLARTLILRPDIILYDAHEVPVGDDQKQHVELARDIALAKGITINGPVIERPAMPDLPEFYRDAIIGGPRAFVIKAENRRTFADAILKKLILEIARFDYRPGDRPAHRPL